MSASRLLTGIAGTSGTGLRFGLRRCGFFALRFVFCLLVEALRLRIDFRFLDFIGPPSFGGPTLVAGWLSGCDVQSGRARRGGRAAAYRHEVT